MGEKNDTPTAAQTDSSITAQTSQGAVVRGTLRKFNRFSVAFELYNPDFVLLASEVLQEFKIVLNGRMIYSGRAVVRNTMDTGPATITCAASLNESSWTDVNLAALNGKLAKKLGADYQDFIREWQKLYIIRPEYKLVLADMQTYFTDLRLWLDQLELNLQNVPPQDQPPLEKQIVGELTSHILPNINDFFERFETIAGSLEEDTKQIHQNYIKRQLHPLVLCSPFAHRTFHKPLGYAGDYEMVNMILRNAPEGGSLFAKILNLWFVRQPPAEAHRNRIAYLTRKLVEETLRAMNAGRKSKIISLACGPAQEVQRFISEQPICNRAELTLLDFNEETLQYIRAIINRLSQSHQREVTAHYVKRSVFNLLKEGSGKIAADAQNQYDYVYCAGLFDYLSDEVCRKLLEVMYSWVAPGGLLVVTNVEPSNPLRNGMEQLLDWHLIYRTGPELFKLKPTGTSRDNAVVRMDGTGVNVFLEIRKPDHV